MKHYFGPQLKLLHHAMDQTITTALANVDLTATQGRIMGFVASQDAPPCPRDIEDEFHLSHPTVSGLLSRLEKKGFITLQADESDRRCKRIYILPKGQQCIETMHQAIMNNENQLVENFTAQEQAQFSAFLSRAMENMGIPPCFHKTKEE